MHNKGYWLLDNLLDKMASILLIQGKAGDINSNVYYLHGSLGKLFKLSSSVSSPVK